MGKYRCPLVDCRRKRSGIIPPLGKIRTVHSLSVERYLGEINPITTRNETSVLVPMKRENFRNELGGRSIRLADRGSGFIIAEGTLLVGASARNACP